MAAAEFGQDVWDFIESLARKRQVLLSSNAFGNILITRASGKAINATLQNRIKDNANNVMSYSVSYDTTGVYNIYRASGQQNPIAINGTESRSNYTIAEQISAIRDPNVRFGRQFSITSESAGSSLADRTKWEYNVRKARSQVYSATVDGFRNQTGALWKINQIVNVDDEYAGIKSRMLINSVQFTLDADGRKTVLALVHKDSYTLTLASAVSIDKIGLGLIEPPVQNVVVLPDSIAPIWRPFNIRDIFEAE
jgi:prophage tail gpP-like protein